MRWINFIKNTEDIEKGLKIKMKGKQGKRLGLVILAIVLVFVFSAMILASSFLLYATEGIDAELDLDMLVANQGRTTKLYYYDGEGKAIELENERIHGAENRIWVPLDEIPEDVKNAFIAIEDHRFYEHDGVDFRRTGGAVLNFLKGGGGGYGGSTITQQLIKNLTGDNQATIKRKLTEIMRALDLEKEISKDTILELYLNTIYLAEGCYGLETAAELYFGKTASELSLVEGATLAAIIQYPTRYDPIQNPKYNRERRDTILWRMHELGLLSEEEYEEAIQTETELHLGKRKENEKKFSWFTEVVIEDVIRDLSEAYHLSKTAASRMLYNGGLSIYITMDAKMQRAVEEYYENVNLFPKSDEGVRATSSAVLIDPKNGHLLAVAGDVGEKTSDRIFNLATQMLRSPGSVIKPISVYTPALDRDLITWASVFDDVPVTFTKSGGGYSAWPKNNPRIYSGLTTVNSAIMNSTNTVAVRVLKQLGETASFRFLKSLGITTLVDYEKRADGKSFSDIAPAPLALGATTRGVSVREMTGAYTMLANGEGIHHDVISYTEVYDKDGNRILFHDDTGERRIGADTADIMTKMLSNVVHYGTASDLTLSRSVPVAGKTGTSNANTDRWFIGYTPELLCGIWYGHKDARDIGTHKKNPAVTIFDGLMSRLYARGASEKLALNKKSEFRTSDNVVSALYCKDSGKSPAYACSHDLRGHRVVLGYFKKGTEPKKACDEHILVDYDRETGAIASEKCHLEGRVRAALVKNYSRSFPCQIYVTDAQYMYRHLPFGALPSADPSEAFFQNYYETVGVYIGVSGVDKARNRYCDAHETTSEETTVEDSTETTDVTSSEQALSETARERVWETEETAETEKKKLVPWW